jgi:chaperonin cofactor prefoldin
MVMKIGKLGRKKSALARLEAQLKEGTKTRIHTFDEKTELSEKDIERIKSEINTLKTRI